MSLPRFAKRRDASELPIVQALTAVGALVARLDQPCDLLVQFRGIRYLLEVKTPHTKAGRERARGDQQAQAERLRLWAIPLVRTPTEALRAIGAVP
jgi:hypothetical protein